MSRELPRRAARTLARDLGAELLDDRAGLDDNAALPADVAAAARVRAAERERAMALLADGKRLSQANRGLRMILVAGVLVVLVSWAGTLGAQYLQLMRMQTLLGADANALRVVCALERPGEHEIGWMHLCETAAAAAVAEQALSSAK